MTSTSEPCRRDVITPGRRWMFITLVLVLTFASSDWRRPTAYHPHHYGDGVVSIVPVIAEDEVEAPSAEAARTPPSPPPPRPLEVSPSTPQPSFIPLPSSTPQPSPSPRLLPRRSPKVAHHDDGTDPPRREWLPVTCDPTAVHLPVFDNVCSRTTCSDVGCHWFLTGRWTKPIDMLKFSRAVVTMNDRKWARSDSKSYQRRCRFSDLANRDLLSWQHDEALTPRYRPAKPISAESIAPESTNLSRIEDRSINAPRINVRLSHESCFLPRVAAGVASGYDVLVLMHAIMRKRLAAERREGGKNNTQNRTQFPAHPIIFIRGDSTYRGVFSSWINLFRRQPGAIDRQSHDSQGYIVTTHGDAICRGYKCWDDPRLAAETIRPPTTSISLSDAPAAPTMLLEVRYVSNVRDTTLWFGRYQKQLQDDELRIHEALLVFTGALFHICTDNVPLQDLQSVWTAERELLRDPKRWRPQYQTMIIRTKHAFGGGPTPTPDLAKCGHIVNDAIEATFDGVAWALKPHRRVSSSRDRVLLVNMTSLYDYGSSDYNMWGGPRDFHSSCILKNDDASSKFPGMPMAPERAQHHCWNIQDAGLIQLAVAAAMADDP